MDLRPPRGPILVVHTGAWNIPAPERAAHREGARRAVLEGWRVLRGGGSATEAVVQAIVSMEDDPALNAGVGSVLCREGWAELDAALMDGSDLSLGAVACVRDVANPIRLADRVRRSEEVLLTGEGASRFARQQGLPTCRPESLILGRERTRLAAWRDRRSERGPADTVGAVALDARGHFAAGSSTGGRPGKPSGRIGDAPIPGAGLLADDRVGAAAATGWGEHLLRFGLARRAVDLGRDHAAQDACWLALKELEERLHGQGGVILLARDGSVGFGFNTGAMGVAWIAADQDEPTLAGIPDE